MSISNAYFHVFKTLLKFCTDTANEIVAAGYSSNIEFINFEEQSTIFVLPASDVFGIGSFSFQPMKEQYTSHIGFAVSTINDEHLFRHAQFIDHIVSKLLPGANFPLYSADTGLQIGSMSVADGTTVRFVERSEDRNIRLILVTLISTPKYHPV